MTRGGKTYFYQLNGHGDVVALTDSTGAVVNTYTYDAFGKLVSQTGTVVNPYTYAGYRYDKETGLYYLQSRYYMGRSLTRFGSTSPVILYGSLVGLSGSKIEAIAKTAVFCRCFLEP
ncbi:MULTISPECIES: RHS repeat-associated core domain-containing protein [unclassified Thermoactinomyces]|uniref:RHS repeat-associated core domain-containing protein n=1 Tax=unclassified Thermoactinomyces TaxID=2634588 RepID=UPI0018DC29DB|nr:MULTISPECIES: RHS repeat-associated core domain-containing protein [unclassified Thermoactinomyces]MBH8598635.1 hypothetical protein [Thermoactinomyces sp. CICC 10523]MBH8605108.1 hypothetical protein [Thermoactinomyces sp. CICC 10522]MBH8609075.1 hypothetical protein [Thermoactinomyces sp. CICC 10521]